MSNYHNSYTICATTKFQWFLKAETVIFSDIKVITVIPSKAHIQYLANNTENRKKKKKPQKRTPKDQKKTDKKFCFLLSSFSPHSLFSQPTFVFAGQYLRKSPSLCFQEVLEFFQLSMRLRSYGSYRCF